MSIENGKVCCNCRHNIRSKDKKYDIIVCHCDIDNAHLSYSEIMTGWCRHWAKERARNNENVSVVVEAKEKSTKEIYIAFR